MFQLRAPTFSMPYDAGSTVSVVMGVVEGETRTTGGSTDYTTPVLGGDTPIAAFIVGTSHQSANDPSETPQAEIALGFSDGTNHRAVFSKSRDNVASTDNDKAAYNTQAYVAMNSDSATIRAATASMIANGVRLTFGTANSPAFRVTGAVLAGQNVAVGDASVTAGTKVTVSCGFRPDVVLAFSVADAFGDAEKLHRISFGIASSKGGLLRQCCITAAETHAHALGRPYLALDTQNVIRYNAHATGVSLAGVAVANLTSGGFDFAPTAAFTEGHIGYLALQLPEGKTCKLVEFDTPTATGDFSITGIDFTPESAIAVVTSLEASDAYASSTDLQSGFAVCLIDGNDDWASSFRIDSGADPTDTGSQASNNALLGPSATDNDAFKATFVSWNEDGATFNASAVHGTARKGFILFIGEAVNPDPVIQFVGMSHADSTGTLSLTSLIGGLETEPAEDDTVVFFYTHQDNSNVDRDMQVTTSGFTEVADLFADDVEDTNLGVFYKIMGPSPDTSIVVPYSGGTISLAAYVFRGVDVSNPLDVAAVANAVQNTSVTDPSAITPATEGALIVAVGANSYQNAAAMAEPADVDNWLYRTDGGTEWANLAAFTKYWNGSGAYDPPSMGGLLLSTLSCATVTLALRPAS